jgi:hypothetical protein
MSYSQALAAISNMIQEKIDKTKKIIIPTFIILFVIGVVETMITSNEFGLSDFILDHLIVPIIILSAIMSTYWILLTDDFWLIYEGSDTELWTKFKTVFKFFVWIPGMGLCFFVITQGFLSIYNRTMGEQRPTLIIGQIIEKDKYRARYYFEIADQTLGRSIEIKVDEAEYERFDTGDNYQTERKIGALGLLYESK